MNSRSLSSVALFLGFLICLIAGCGDDQPERYGLSGTISFEGKPIAFGWIVFEPESGPGGMADIENGKYQTPEGFGTIGGKHTINVNAFDGVATPDPNVEGGMNTNGKLMFSHSFTMDIPKETSNFDIDLSQEDIKQAKETAL